MFPDTQVEVWCHGRWRSEEGGTEPICTLDLKERNVETMAAEACAAFATLASRVQKAFMRRICQPNCAERSVEMMDAEVNVGPVL